MAINPADLYTGQVTAPSQDYPLGSARDVTAPGSGDGTPFVASLVNDTWGFYQALLAEATVTASGTPETALASQYLESLKAITRGELATDSEPGTIQLDDSFKATADDYGLVKANKFQKKTISQNYQAEAGGATVSLPELTFNSLEVGNYYKLTMRAYFRNQAGSSDQDRLNPKLNASMAGSQIATSQVFFSFAQGGMYVEDTTVAIFEATADTITFNFNVSTNSGSTANVQLTTGDNYTFAILEELNNYVQTTDFT